MIDRHIYLEDIPLEEARARIREGLARIGRADALPAEEIALLEAPGRITAQTIFARLSSPHYHAAAMDGYAVRASDTRHATETQPLRLDASQIHAVNTGQPMPPHTDAVIMIEHVQLVDDGILIVAPVVPRQHVRMMGEDMVATEVILPANHCIRPVDLGALAGCGYDRVPVRRQPHVVLIPTGSELVDVTQGQTPEAGQIIEYNSLVLGAQIREWGGRITRLPITPDAPEEIEAALQTALDEQPDLILLLSGTSAGSKDFAARQIQQAGQLLVHGVAVRPGHPVIAGTLQQTLIIGVPGYPVSAALTGELFVQPVIKQWLGQNKIDKSSTVTAINTRRLASPTGDDDFVRVTLARVGDKLLATPLSRGAGVITSLVRADGLAHIPRFQEGVERGEPLTVHLYRDQRTIDNTVLAIGSHDPMLDLLGQFMAERNPSVRLTSANVGSMGGIVAIRREEAHISGVHLLDADSGDYNLPEIQRRLAGVPLMLITFAEREQGLMVAAGNPHTITSLDDLPRLQFVNRQPGAGTRLLLDYELRQRHIDPASINGYAHEEPTHLAVAAAIASGVADCGLGVRSAAQALRLDFVPVGWERFDLIIPHAHRQHPGIIALRETLQDDAFKQALAAQAGYRTALTGSVQHQTQMTDD